MKRVSILRGVLVASSLIGPIVLVVGAVAVAASTSTDRLDALWVAPVLCIPAFVIGFLVSFVPNLLGASLLGWLGRGNIGVRLPVMWALAGGGVGAVLGALISADEIGAPAALPIAGIGAASALLCRWKTSWQ